MKWRLLVTPNLSGAMNMAIDAELCARVGAGQSSPVLRFYSWRPHCVSLGFHQKSSSIDLAACRRAGIDVVRRPTGGRAVLHAQEYTYSVAVQAGHPDFGKTVHQTYGKISAWLLRGLEALGIEARGIREIDGNNGSVDGVVCFAKAGRHEVVIGKKKVIGSAQRRWPHAILQHGSILTGRGHQDLAWLMGVPEGRRKGLYDMLEQRTGCLAERLDKLPTLGDFARLMAMAWIEALDCRVEADTLSEEEWQAARDAAGVYHITGTGTALSGQTRSQRFNYEMEPLV